MITAICILAGTLFYFNSARVGLKYLDGAREAYWYFMLTNIAISAVFFVIAIERVK